MRVTLECGCRIDDAYKSTIHQPDGRHYPIGTSPKTYCFKCDRYRIQCGCELPTESPPPPRAA